YLMAILDNPAPDYSAATCALQAVDPQDLLSVAHSLLKRIIAPPTRRFIIDFLLATAPLNQLETPEETKENQLQINNENIVSNTIVKYKNGSSFMNQDALVEECQEAQPEKNSMVDSQISVAETNTITINFRKLRQEVMGLILVEDISQAGRDLAFATLLQ
ncbi:unnamed protein product, partial [Meganyctiphanes norvegica]